jgi:uncharacterized protein (UPF0333 family)
MNAPFWAAFALLFAAIVVGISGAVYVMRTVATKISEAADDAMDRIRRTAHDSRDGAEQLAGR